MKTLVKNNPTFFPAIPFLLDEFFNKDWNDSSLSTWRNPVSTLPAVNISEDNDNIHISMAAPGLKRDDFKIEYEHEVLVVSSEHQNTQEDNTGEYFRREFNYEGFRRAFTLPANKVKGDAISAKYTDGILKITVPKTEDSKKKPARMITVG